MRAPIVAATSQTIGAFIDNLCSRNTVRNTVIIACCSRSNFLEQLLAYAAPTEDPSERADIDNVDRIDTDLHEHNTDNSRVSVQPNRRLLLPILRTLAISSRTKLVFCPNIPSFRAYMSTLPARFGPEDDPAPNVIVIDVLAMHHGTSEFTIQGLSRTFSMLASINASLPQSMRLVECLDCHHRSIDRGPRIWQAEVPLLSGSVKIGEAGQGWAIRTISIKRFAVRWFEFEEEART